MLITHTVPQVLVSRIDVYQPFHWVQLSEKEAVEYCIIVWGPLTEAVHVMVETTDSALALGKSNQVNTTYVTCLLWLNQSYYSTHIPIRAMH